MQYDPELSKIKELLAQNQNGLTILEISDKIGINRNSVAKYLDILLVSGQVELKNVGPAKLYFLSNRVSSTSILDFLSDGILVFDQLLRVSQINSNFIAHFHVDKDQLLGKDIHSSFFANLFSTDFRVSIEDALKGVSKKREEVVTCNQDTFYFKIKTVPMTLDNGRPGVAVFFEDVTPERETYHKLKRSESKMFSFLEAVPVGIFILRKDGKPYYANEKAKELLGKGIVPSASKEKLSEVYNVYKQGTKKLYPTQELPAVRALQGERVEINDIEIERDGKRIPINVWAAPILDDEKNVKYSIAAFMRR